MTTSQKAQSGQHFIDITDEICPMTFVKTKLMRTIKLKYINGVKPRYGRIVGVF